jgi:hypothetical protein
VEFPVDEAQFFFSSSTSISPANYIPPIFSSPPISPTGTTDLFEAAESHSTKTKLNDLNIAPHVLEVIIEATYKL